MGWEAGEYLDLETMEWVESWKEGKQIAISDAQVGGRMVWRGFEYFVNKDSESVIELGTRDHPYKKLGFVFVEILNFHSHSDRNLTVYVLEGTVNEMITGGSFVVNATNVKMMTYSLNEEETMNKATILWVDNTTLIQNFDTSFNLLSDFTLKVSQMIYVNPGITTTEKGILQQSKSWINVIRSNFEFYNFVVTTNYTLYNDNNDILRAVYLQHKRMTLKNIDFKTQAGIFTTNHPLNFHMENIDVDYYRNKFGFNMLVMWNYPEAALNTSTYINNITFYYSKAREVQKTKSHAITHIAGDDFVIENYDFKIWIKDEDTILIASSVQASCLPNTGTIRYYNMTNGKWTKPEDSAESSITLMLGVATDPYRQTEMNLVNNTWSNSYRSKLHNLYSIGNMMSTFNTIGNTFYNASTLQSLQTVWRFKKVTMTNLHLENVDSNNLYLIRALQAQIVNINNVTILNWATTGRETIGIVALLTLNEGVVTAKNVNVINLNLAYRSAIQFQPFGYGSFTITDSAFTNVTINSDSSLIQTGIVSNLNVKNLKFSDIKNSSPLDSGTILFDPASLMINSGSVFKIEEVSIDSSTIPFILINSIQITTTEKISINLSSINYSNSVFENQLDLVSLGNIETLTNLEINLSNIAMSNITFMTRGNLLKLQHQTQVPVIINNLNLNDITGGSIFIQSANLQNTQMATKVIMNNMNANNINGETNSLIATLEGGNLSIFDSVFTNIYNYESGSVINGKGKNSITEVHNSFFTNNTSVYGGVASAQDTGVIKFYDWTIYNNFAIQSGVIQSGNDGYFEFYRSIIKNNYALSLSVSELFVSGTQSVINNSTIQENVVLTKDEILTELSYWEMLWFLSENYKAYLISRPSLFTIPSTKYWFQTILSSLSISNSSLITAQSLFLNSYLSTISISSATLTSITTSSSIFLIISSSFDLVNSSASSIRSSDSSLSSFSEMLISVTSGSTCLINNLVYMNSSVPMINAENSKISLINVTGQDLNLKEVFLRLDGWEDVEIMNSVIKDINTEDKNLIYISNSKVKKVMNLTVNEVNAVAIVMVGSHWQEFNEIYVADTENGITFIDSEVKMLANSIFMNWNSNDISTGGAISLENSNIDINNVNFQSNSAQKGGAILISCSTSANCNTSISNSLFSNNSASVQGGAISYDFLPPLIASCLFLSNSAKYGPNLASYPIRITSCISPFQNITLSSVGSGIPYPDQLTLWLLDHQSQVLSLMNKSQIKITSVSSEAYVLGVNSAQITEGKATFENLIFEYKPGGRDVEFKMSWADIDKEKTKFFEMPTEDVIKVNFRFCNPGETIEGGTKWREWSAGTFSLGWNETEWKTWIENAVWLGGEKVAVRAEYWRHGPNSTDIIRCPRPQSCKGGYYTKSKDSVEWEQGYTSYLWAKCGIVNGEKYQRVTSYKCSKWPSPALNAIRVFIFFSIAFGYLVLLIVMTIRKKKKNQTSILIRIMTNYLQLIAATMSFNLRFPTFFGDMFGPIESIGSAYDTFLSFDCFIEDTEMRAFAPTTELFKVFLTGLLPIILGIIFWILWSILYLINKQLFSDIKRYIMVSFVWIIFMLHPTITKSTFNLFECLQISKDSYKMKMNMDYEWYSKDHIIWIVFIWLPNIILWVIGAPLLVFIIMFKQRAHLDDGPIKKYLFILYQGLKTKAFYWEFVNTIRKSAILILNTILSVVSINYRILIALVFLITLIRLQLRLKPFQKEQNNNIEIKAITAGMVTLFWGIIFNESEDGAHSGFSLLSLFILCIMNASFFLEWTYLLLVSYKFKNPKIKTLIKAYAVLLWYKKLNRKKKYEDDEEKSEQFDSKKIEPKKSVKNSIPNDSMISPKIDESERTPFENNLYDLSKDQSIECSKEKDSTLNALESKFI